jgi:hypothetical protein
MTPTFSLRAQRQLRFRIPEFRIPDFPLGALLATILLSVGALLAFPDIPYAFVWELLVIVSTIVWGLGAGFLRGSLPDEVSGSTKSQPSGQNIYGPPTADFAALVDAINTQGRANRKEERREDFRRQFIDVTTIMLLALTVVAIFRQVNEMVKVYGADSCASRSR